MGGGSWSYDTYSARDSARIASGRSAFAYSDDVRSGRKAFEVHPDLKVLNVKFRESCDSDEHPDSTAIALSLDVTGSMLGVPPIVQQKLKQLFGLLLRKGFVPDPQIMVGAITDAKSERIIIQVSQFESDNRIDENLEKLVLEGGGGGGNHESYELMLYFMARHTKIDCFDKHGRKGYLFIIGDECAYPVVSKTEVAKLFGDQIDKDIPIEEIMKEVKKRYNVFYLHPEDASYVNDPTNRDFWSKLLGQNYIEHVETESICETIASLIGATEGTVDSLADITAALTDVGASASAVRAVSRAVSPFVGKTVAKGSGAGLPSLDSTKGSGARRL